MMLMTDELPSWNYLPTFNHHQRNLFFSFEWIAEMNQHRERYLSLPCTPMLTRTLATDHPVIWDWRFLNLNRKISLEIKSSMFTWWSDIKPHLIWTRSIVVSFCDNPVTKAKVICKIYIISFPNWILIFQKKIKYEFARLKWSFDAESVKVHNLCHKSYGGSRFDFDLHETPASAFRELIVASIAIQMLQPSFWHDFWSDSTPLKISGSSEHVRVLVWIRSSDGFEKSDQNPHWLKPSSMWKRAFKASIDEFSRMKP